MNPRLRVLRIHDDEMIGDQIDVTDSQIAFRDHLAPGEFSEATQVERYDPAVGRIRIGVEPA